MLERDKVGNEQVRANVDAYVFDEAQRKLASTLCGLCSRQHLRAILRSERPSQYSIDNVKHINIYPPG